MMLLDESQPSPMELVLARDESKATRGRTRIGQHADRRGSRSPTVRWNDDEMPEYGWLSRRAGARTAGNAVLIDDGVIVIR